VGGPVPRLTVPCAFLDRGSGIRLTRRTLKHVSVGFSRASIHAGIQFLVCHQKNLFSCLHSNSSLNRYVSPVLKRKWGDRHRPQLSQSSKSPNLAIERIFGIYGSFGLPITQPHTIRRSQIRWLTQWFLRSMDGHHFFVCLFARPDRRLVSGKAVGEIHLSPFTVIIGGRRGDTADGEAVIPNCDGQTRLYRPRSTSTSVKANVDESAWSPSTRRVRLGRVRIILPGDSESSSSLHGSLTISSCFYEVRGRFPSSLSLRARTFASEAPMSSLTR